MGINYKSSGVDIDAENRAIDVLGKWIKETFKHGKVLSEFGHYANLIDIGGNKALALATDGVGSKVLVAELAGKYDTVPIDMIAMNVNDIICIGAKPIAMVDYLAVNKPDPEIFDQIGKGLAKGAEEAGVVFLGGETASLPDIIAGKGEFAFDLAGTALGIVDKDKVITGEKVKSGDKIIGLYSSGIHSNGLSLARKLLLPLGLDFKLDSGKTVAEEILTPTRIYVKPVLKVVEKYHDSVHGLAHITGSAFLKLRRLKSKARFEINLPSIPLIFKKLQELGVEEKEMYRS
jgi:phosphoribosylformylglycinamidine cyclo-ligase